MKQIKFLITGLLFVTAFSLSVSHARADQVCNPNNINTHYKALYCGIRLNDNEAADEEIVSTLASQFNMDKEIIKEILAGTICKTIMTYTAEDQAKLPESVRNACLPSGLSLEQTMGNWTVFTDIRNTYEKESVIQKSASSLKSKFKASEQYWDGTISGNDAPFDLIVDLNLIEIVLFGSKAQWMQDVYSFPEEEGAEEGETPMDQALPPEEGGAETPATPAPSEGGVTVTEEGEGQAPPDCVPPSDPNAETGDGPASDYQNPVCGNGTMDVLLGEQCDDGNKLSGDGCNQYCRIESGGANDMCVDPEAVTFKSPSPSAGVAGLAPETGTETGGANCPPGTVPKKGAAITGEEAVLPPTVAQSPEYPGPYLGGTLKQYPESNPPICPLGQSPVSIDVAGETQYVKDSEGNIECIPTQFCADFNAARDFLFGEGWQDDDVKMNIAPAIEALFCVNVIKANRPQSPYNMIEGCVDCHITAMADALEKALEKNVSPLVNTTNAFGISSKYGPTFSFNLNTAAKSVIKYQYSDTASTAIKKANEEAAKSLKANTPPELSIFTSDSPLAELKKQTSQAEKTLAGIQQDIKIFNMGGNVVSDQEVGGRIIPLLTQMRDSFINMESKYEGLVGSLQLDEKEQCKP